MAVLPVIADRLQETVPVVCEDTIGSYALCGTVKQNNRDVQFLQQCAGGDGPLIDERDDQPVDAAPSELLNRSLLSLQITVGAGNKELTIGFDESVLDTLSYRREDLVSQSAHEKTDAHRCVEPQGAREFVSLVSQLLHSVLNRGPGMGADVWMVVDDPRHRG